MTGAATGPDVVAVGGGHGTAVTLRAARRYARSLTAVVSVADDGGSSGRLRQLLDVVALGDIRKCLVALAAPGSVLARTFEHRFEADELAGHALGNLVLAALVETTGDLEAGISAAGDLLGASGTVLPATTEPVVLKARVDGTETEVAGQVAVAAAAPIRHVSLVPGDAAAPAAAVAALRRADQVVIGPGSLYTSILAAVAVPGIARALDQARGRRVYVCNLRPEQPETAGYTVADHVGALAEHGVTVDVVLHDDGPGLAVGDVAAAAGRPVRRVARPLAGSNGLVHDPARLAVALEDLLA